MDQPIYYVIDDSIMIPTIFLKTETIITNLFNIMISILEIILEGIRIVEIQLESTIHYMQNDASFIDKLLCALILIQLCMIVYRYSLHSEK